MDSKKLCTSLAAIVGDRYVLSDADSLKTYGKDWTKQFEPNPECIVLPANTLEVSRIVAFCNQNKIAVVPSGGRTGLAGGAVALNKEVVISLQRMNKILHVDTIGLTLRAEAGVTTQAVQEAAKAEGLFFALDLASKGSCHIGGNVATNAGGLKLIRYGGAREQVLGLEVVLPNGDILDLNSALRKNNTGYDLKQLYIGSEGTLGIITQVTVRLLPKPRELQLACMATTEFALIPKILQACNRLGVQPLAFEFVDRACLDIVLKYNSQLRCPFPERPNFLVLLEIEKGSGIELDVLLENLAEQELITDATIAASSAQFREIWALRENVAESVNHIGFVRKNDISVPIDALDSFVRKLETNLGDARKDITIVVFGHIGDGNLHINYLGTKELGKEKFKAVVDSAEHRVFELIKEHKGSISAEHGIGLVKKNDILFSCNEMQLNMMRSIKKTLDPNYIMNPGKIF